MNLKPCSYANTAEQVQRPQVRKRLDECGCQAKLLVHIVSLWNWNVGSWL